MEIKFKYVKEFNAEDLSEGSERLVLGKEYSPGYTPQGWIWTIEACATESRYKHHFQKILVEEKEKERTVKALRFNDGKPEFSLVDLNSLKPCAEVLAFGAKKYSRDNWKKGFPISSILNSMLRHIAALQDGEEIDPESGLPHIGHIQCNALFLGGKNNTNDLKNADT